MFNELDPELTRRFERIRAPLAGDEFTANLLVKIEGMRRTRLWGRTLGIIAIMIIVSLNIRLILELTAAAVRFVGEVSLTPADMVVSPWGWAVSMLIGAWVILRTRPSRR